MRAEEREARDHRHGKQKKVVRFLTGVEFAPLPQGE